MCFEKYFTTDGKKCNIATKRWVSCTKEQSIIVKSGKHLKGGALYGGDNPYDRDGRFRVWVVGIRLGKEVMK